MRPSVLIHNVFIYHIYERRYLLSHLPMQVQKPAYLWANETNARKELPL